MSRFRFHAFYHNLNLPDLDIHQPDHGPHGEPLLQPNQASQGRGSNSKVTDALYFSYSVHSLALFIHDDLPNPFSDRPCPLLCSLMVQVLCILKFVDHVGQDG